MGIDSDESFFRECHELLNSYLKTNQVRNVSNDCPAIYALVLTVIAAELGTGGELWDRILEEDVNGLHLAGLESTNSSKYGEQFRQSLNCLGLPDFSHVGGMRNLSPILMHAGIPIHSAAIVWRKVQEFVFEGTTSGRDIVQELRSDRLHLRYFNMPAQRFIREAGSFAVDTIQRMANVILSRIDDPEASPVILGSRHGLPAKFVNILDSAPSEASTSTFVVPSAHIYLDLVSGAGPYCHLPPVRARSQEVLWTVCGRNHRASGFDDKFIQLEPVPSWSFEALANGKRLRTRQFPSITDGGIWLFAETRNGIRLVHTSDGVEEGTYYLLAPKGDQVVVRRNTGEYVAPVVEDGGLGNSWSRHYVIALDLIDAYSFQILRDGNEVGHEGGIDVLPAPLRPELVGNECSDIRDADGLRVFSGVPYLKFLGVATSQANFTVALRSPSGSWIERPIAPDELVEGKLELDGLANWGTGRYRIEVVGPMGSGMSETFVVLVGGRIELRDGFFLPEDRVQAKLAYRMHFDGVEDSIILDFDEYENRKLVATANSIPELLVTIPRISFDVGGVDSPPDYGRPAAKVLAFEDLEVPQGQRLYVRTGKPAVLSIVARDAEGNLVHTHQIATSGWVASGAMDIQQILESIRYLGASVTSVVAVLDGIKDLLILTIRQNLDFKVGRTEFKMLPDEAVGEVEVEVETQMDTTSVHVILQSLERVWDEAIVVKVPARNEITKIRKVVCQSVPPGLYAVELAVGANSRPVRSTRRERVLGDIAQRERYLQSISGNPSKLAERVVTGEVIPRSELSKLSEMDLLRVVHFLVVRNTKLSSLSKEFESSLRVIASEGNSRIIAEWMTRMGAEVASTRDLEMFVVRLFSIIIDNPIHDMDLDGKSNLESNDVLASRLWEISPIIGVAYTYKLTSEIVEENFRRFGLRENEPSYEELAGLTWPDLDELIVRSKDTVSLLSPGYAALNFRTVWKQCWTGNGPDEDLLADLGSLATRGKKIVDAAMEESSFTYPSVVASTIPDRFRPKRTQENLTIAKFVHNLFRLSWLAVRAETSQNLALQACEILAERYRFAKGLTDRSLVTAIIVERRGNSSNV